MDLRSAIASPSSTDPLGTVGVDMSVHPLSLGTSRLHSAVNLQFVEGRIKTRPGFRYQKLGLSGQFQGAFHYAPSKGLSARPFAAHNTALVVAIAGKLSVLEATHGTLSCGARPLCGDYDFSCRGRVHLFQAENWLIAQNKESDTLFWEGFGCLTRSPGMGATPEDLDPLVPSAEAPTRGRCWTTGTFVQFLVLDDTTGEVLPNSLVRLLYYDREDYAVTTDDSGKAVVYPVPKIYDYTASHAGYTTLVVTALVILPDQTKFITVRLRPTDSPVDPFIGLSITLQYLAEDDVCESGHQCDAAVFNVYANDVLLGVANLNNVVDGGSRSASFEVTPEQAEEIAEGSADGHTIGLFFECDPTFPGFDPVAYGGGCHPNIGQLVVMDALGTELYNGCPSGTTIDIDVNPAP